MHDIPPEPVKGGCTIKCENENILSELCCPVTLTNCITEEQ